MLSEITQTDNACFINFACEMFLQALEAEALHGEEDEEKYQKLLKKAEHIIVRIRNKAATSYGLVGGGGFGLDKRDISAVLAAKPMSPSRYQPIEKSWHFDISSKTTSVSPRRRMKLTKNTHQVGVDMYEGLEQAKLEEPSRLLEGSLVLNETGSFNKETLGGLA